MTKKRERHAVVKSSAITVDGKEIGGSFMVSYEDGPPKFGKCQWMGCAEKATKETLLGSQFCEGHFSEFMFGDW